LVFRRRGDRNLCRQFGTQFNLIQFPPAFSCSTSPMLAPTSAQLIPTSQFLVSVGSKARTNEGGQRHNYLESEYNNERVLEGRGAPRANVGTGRFRYAGRANGLSGRGAEPWPTGDAFEETAIKRKSSKVCTRPSKSAEAADLWDIPTCLDVRAQSSGKVGRGSSRDQQHPALKRRGCSERQHKK